MATVAKKGAQKKAVTRKTNSQTKKATKKVAKPRSAPKKKAVKRKKVARAGIKSILQLARFEKRASGDKIKRPKSAGKNGPKLKKRDVGSGFVITDASSIHLYEDVQVVVEASLDKTFQAFLKSEGETSESIENKYDAYQIASLVQYIIKGLGKVGPNQKAFESAAQEITKVFVKKQSRLFKRHFPHFEKWLKEDFSENASSCCISIKDIEHANEMIASSKDLKKTIQNAIKLILSNVLATSLIIIAFKKIKIKHSYDAEELLHATLKTLQERIQKTLREVDKALKHLELESKHSDDRVVGLRLTQAVKDELLRSKRFLINVDRDLSMVHHDPRNDRGILDWVKQDLQAFIGILEDKIQIATLIGDNDLLKKLRSLRSKLHLNLSYPNTVQVKDIKRNKDGYIEPDTLKNFLFKRFSKQLEDLGHQDEHLERKFNEQYMQHADELYNASNKIFWVPYTEVKQCVDNCIEVMRNVEGLMQRIDGLSENAIRPRKSYGREIENKLSRLPDILGNLEAAYARAEDKAKQKNYDLDFTVTSFVDDLKNAMPSKGRLRDMGYID